MKPRPQQFAETIERFGLMVNHVLFATGSPHWDSDAPDFALPTILSDEIKAKIHDKNGKRLYNL